MKLCYVHIVTAECSQPFLTVLGRNFQKILRKDTQVKVKSVNPGLDRATDLHVYFHFLNKRSIIEKIIEAEEESYDAVVVGCYLDPGVREARATVKIPVIGIAQASMLLACQLGRRFAVITLNEPTTFPDMEDHIRVQGLDHRTVFPPLRPISMATLEAFSKGIKDPALVAKDVQERGRECANDGADVVIVGCNGLGPLCTAAGLTHLKPEGIPILDCTAVGLKAAEFICEISKTLQIPATSRGAAFALPSAKDLNRVRTAFGLKTR